MALMDLPEAAAPPIQKDVDGVFRVGGTRVRLATVITAFQNGCTPEEILFKYPSLSLADIYSVIGYYLQNRKNVEDYLMAQRTISDRIDSEIEEQFPSAGIRERLLARRKANSA